MRQRALTLFLVTLISQAIAAAQNAVPRYSITITAVIPTVKVGSELRIRIVQTNVTDTDQLFWREKIAGLHGEYLYQIDVLQANGKRAPRSEYFKEVRDDAGNFMAGTAHNAALVHEKPGESIVSSIDLNELYVLKPGKYTIQLYRKDEIDGMIVKSNIITVRITP